MPTYSAIPPIPRYPVQPYSPVKICVGLLFHISGTPYSARLNLGLDKTPSTYITYHISLINLPFVPSSLFQRSLGITSYSQRLVHALSFVLQKSCGPLLFSYRFCSLRAVSLLLPLMLSVIYPGFLM